MCLNHAFVDAVNRAAVKIAFHYGPMLACAMFVFALSASVAFAYQPAYQPKRARINLAREAAECAAYFISVSQAPSLDAETKDRLYGYSKDMIYFSIILTSEKTAKARVELAQKTMILELECDWGNV